MTIGSVFSRYDIVEFHKNYPRVTVSWIPIAIASIAFGLLSAIISSETTRSNIVRPLLIGVITLFTISLTVTIMGIQVASDRYTHRVDSIVIQKLTFWLHFLPHLIAILLAILLISLGRFGFLGFFVFIFFITASLLSIFPFLQWLLRTLSPDMMLSAALHQIDPDFLDNVEEVVENERTEIIEDGDRDRIINIFREIAYLGISDNDPVDRSTDIIRSRILDNDTGTTRSLIEKYTNYTESVLDHRYEEFRSSHSNAQLVSWYLLGSFEDLFQLSVKEENHRVAREIITLQRKSIQDWSEKDPDGVPEVFFRVFNSISVEYLAHCNRSQARGVAKQYRKIVKVINSDIDSSSGEMLGANTSNFISSCMAYAEVSIQQDYVESATLIRSTLRSFVDTCLRNPPSNPNRAILMIGLIGELFASEEIVSKSIVANANEVWTSNEAESTITILVTFKDKIEEGKKREARNNILEDVLNEIERINLALEDRDRDVASKFSYDENLVLEIIRGARLFRSPFSVTDLIEEIDVAESVGNDKIERICTELADSDVFQDRENGEYMKSSL